MEELLRQVLNGAVSLEDARKQFALRDDSRAEAVSEPTLQVPGAAVDLARRTRCGFPEVVYGPGKPPELIVRIFRELLEAGQCCLATRLSHEQSTSIQEAFTAADINPLARTARMTAASPPAKAGHVTVITAGSSDRGG